MSADSLKKIWLTAAVLLLCAVAGLYWSNIRLVQSLRGNLAFADKSGTVPEFAKIVVSRPDNVITVYDDDKMWRVVEADNYYAGFKLMRSLSASIASAHIGREAAPDEVEQADWTSVALFDRQGQKQSEVMISAAARPGSHYLRYPDAKEVYLSDWKTQLPESLSSWTRQPLLAFSGVEISRFKSGDVFLSRRYEGAAFYDSRTNRPYGRYDYVRVFDLLADLRYDKVLSSQEFEQGLYPNLRTIELTTFDGLISSLRIYTDYKEYWLSVSLSTTTLPSNSISDYIEHNRIFYDDWWFRLPADAGRMLFMFKL